MCSRTFRILPYDSIFSTATAATTDTAATIDTTAVP